MKHLFDKAENITREPVAVKTIKQTRLALAIASTVAVAAGVYVVITRRQFSKLAGVAKAALNNTDVAMGLVTASDEALDSVIAAAAEGASKLTDSALN